jgi:hypothetical protein
MIAAEPFLDGEIRSMEGGDVFGRETMGVQQKAEGWRPHQAAAQEVGRG